MRVGEHGESAGHENSPRNRNGFWYRFCIYQLRMKRERQLEQGSAGTTPLQPASLSRSGESGNVPEAALAEMPVTFGAELNAEGAGIAITRIPIEVDVAISIRKFRVRNLLSLSGGR